MSEENMSDNSPEKESSSDIPSIPELEEFIFHPDQYTGGVVPRELPAPDVAKFLLGKIQKDAKLQTFIQVEQVANFYDTNEVAAKFKTFLSKDESNEEENRRSMVIDRIIARLGDDQDVEFAKNYYKHLIQKATSVAEFEDLIKLHEALNLGGDSSAIRSKINARLAELEAKKDSGYEARLEYLKFDETVMNLLTRAEKVKAVKEKILGMSDRKQRLNEEIKAYLRIEYGYIEFLQPWAARRIRQETWGQQPADQRFRVDRQPLKKEVSTVFRDYLNEELGKFPTLTKEEKESAKISILRAIKFFDGQVSEEEDAFLDVFKGTQADILANEGFLLPKGEGR
ncbi:MAG: hypothetical protein R2747_02010 [Pyrinomonadaceae bacterium]